jgi:hypothetical protein
LVGIPMGYKISSIYNGIYYDAYTIKWYISYVSVVVIERNTMVNESMGNNINQESAVG